MDTVLFCINGLFVAVGLLTIGMLVVVLRRRRSVTSRTGSDYRLQRQIAKNLTERLQSKHGEEKR